MYYQQGDVLIKKIKKLPLNLTKVNPKNGRIVLAEGEVTGHCHKITDIEHVSLYKDQTEKYFIEVEKESKLKHEEHNKIDIEPGIYQIDIVKEYDHFLEEAREVQD